MNFSFVPSLQCMAAVKIATILWNQADVRALIVDGCNSRISSKQHFRKIAEKVIEKVLLLPQPALLKDKTIAVVKPLGDQIRKWKEYTEAFCHLKFSIKNFPKEFVWTSQGTLDKKKMAESLVGDITIPERDRYHIECLYCIETQRDKSIQFQVTQSCLLDTFKAYWAYNVTGNEDELDKVRGRDTSKTPYQCAFEWAITWNNRVAAEYYFHKLTPELKEESLSDFKLLIRIRFLNFDIFCFLILQMNEQQQSRLLKERAVHVLRSLLEWPWQGFFMETADRVKDFLDVQMYYNLLDRIVNKIELEYKYCSYRELFEKLWLQIPATHKKYVIRECTSGNVFRRLFKVNDEKNILLILKDATLEEKDYVFSSGSISICLDLTNADQWDLLKVFISECITTHEKMIEFKDRCKKRDFGEKFFQLMDELIEKRSEKRGAEEGNFSVSKRLHSSSSESAM